MKSPTSGLMPASMLEKPGQSDNNPSHYHRRGNLERLPRVASIFCLRYRHRCTIHRSFGQGAEGPKNGTSRVIAVQSNRADSQVICRVGKPGVRTKIQGHRSGASHRQFSTRESYGEIAKG